MKSARIGVRSAAFLTWTAVSVVRLEEAAKRVADPELPAVVDVHLRRYIGRVMDILKIQAQYHPERPPPKDAKGRLVVANHQSAVDIGILLGHFGGKCLSRADVAGWPVLGRAARSVGTIFVDRDDGHSGASAIRAIRRRLKDGDTVVAFPEGRTTSGDDVLPFQPGVFAAARGLECEILPVGIAYRQHNAYVDKSFAQHLSSVAADPEAHVAAHVGSAFEASGRTAELAKKAEREVQQLVRRARSDIGRP